MYICILLTSGHASFVSTWSQMLQLTTSLSTACCSATLCSHHIRSWASALISQRPSPPRTSAHACPHGTNQSVTCVLGVLQAKSNTPYVVLTGNIRPGQSSDPKSGYATVDSQVALTPMLGGGRTPLVGDRKVEAMLGIRKRPGNDSMPPPAGRPNKKARQD